ncbi:MAG: hypothetical protein B1H40_03440 [Candidatus Latescibacteria bacterium 4484_181]|nr:MAG: hypothetical protein B1H40_03440 [Candidatus Latescibacteria bacterium 4484_181]
MTAQQDFHFPVLLRQTVEYLLTNPDGIYVDGTVGGGGHAYQVLSGLGERGRLIAIDQDPEAIQAAKRRLSLFGEKVSFHLSGFQNLPAILQQQGIEAVDGILLDLGVSSHQLDSPRRGFSYRFRGPLDMRMNPQAQKTAWQVVNTYPEEELELEILRPSVEQCINLLKAGGRLCIISYHSLEDRTIKSLFIQYSKGCICPPRLPTCVCGGKKILKLIAKRPILPSEEEKKANRRARSAKLRVAEKTADSK